MQTCLTINSKGRQKETIPTLFLTLGLLMTCCLCKDPAVHPAEKNTDQFAVRNSTGRGLCDGGVSNSVSVLHRADKCITF